jgi:hypothetical protein
MEQQNGTTESSSMMEQKNGAENGYDKIVVIHQGKMDGFLARPEGLIFYLQELESSGVVRGLWLLNGVRAV